MSRLGIPARVHRSSHLGCADLGCMTSNHSKKLDDVPLRGSCLHYFLPCVSSIYSFNPHLTAGDNVTTLVLNMFLGL